MQTHNLRLPKNYRDTASDFYIRVGIGLIAILLILNIALLVLFLKEIKVNRSAFRVIQDTGKTLALLQDSLARTDMQKAFVQLAEARRQIGTAVPPAPAVPPVPAAKQVAEAPLPAAKAAAEPKAPPAPAAAKAEVKAPGGRGQGGGEGARALR